MSQSSAKRSVSADSASAIMSHSSGSRRMSANSASKVNFATTSKESTEETVLILYEGNFDEWLREISDMFIAKGRPTQVYPSIAHVENDTITYHPSTFSDLDAIFDRISPELEARIPLDDLEAKAGVLYAWLENLCKKPFRILDLPVELRLQIYEEVIEPIYKRGTSRSIINDDGDEPDRRRPALAQVSQQLRQEVLPVYITFSNFYAYAIGDVNPHWLADMLTQWEFTWPGTSLQALNSFSLVMPTEQCVYDDRSGTRQERIVGSQINVQVSFNESKGLQINQHHSLPYLKPESRKMLNDVCAEVEEERKESNAKGEAILVLLRRLCEMGDPDSINWLGLWEDDVTEQEYYRGSRYS
ncbi:hypothetical protein PRZ48_010088 [Zasmidium cellare]|uniref:Uncharacterized protein n=1 Tax=Zasmidium cellare TaxID=395010 RepID=A0ABR0EE59_ZASCE|nr:hypothetical protein PRZ48_010088 [Zasmidium cellare]